MNGKSCFFIGHRETPDYMLPILQDAVNAHVETHGVTEFYVGHYGNFDHLAARAVIAAKQLHPEISLFLLTPYHPTERPIKTPKGFDSTFYPPGMEHVPRKFSIVRANRYMVDHVNYLIAYVRHPASKARDLLEYAQRQAHSNKITVSNIALHAQQHVLPSPSNSPFPR